MTASRRTRAAVLAALLLATAGCTGGSPTPTPAPAPTTVAGVDPAPGTDDGPALRRALDVARPGDEIVLPPGVVDLLSTDDADPTANLVLPSGVSLRGAGAGVTFLVSSLDRVDEGAVLRGAGVEDVTLEGFTVTSTYAGPLGTDPGDDSAGGGPMYGIHLGTQDGVGSSRVLVRDVHVERFQRHGISLKGTHAVTVTGCVVADATSVGPGGAGYGIAVEGFSGGRPDGAPDDSRDNHVVRNELRGEHLRHAILLQFPTHHNVVAHNVVHGSVLDAIDLHGEGEHHNEIRGNTVVGGQAAGIALGNGGGARNRHDASGPGNRVHGNTLVDNRVGVLVILGTPGTVIEENDVRAGATAEAGIVVRNGPGTRVLRNRVTGGSAPGFWAVLLEEDRGTEGRGTGRPRDVRVVGNTIEGSANGIRAAAGDDVVVAGNSVTSVPGTPLDPPS